MSHYLLTFPSELGWMGLLVQAQPNDGAQIQRLTFGHASPDQAIAALPTRPADAPTWRHLCGSRGLASWGEFRAWAESLQAFAAGYPVALDPLPLQLDYLSDFGRRVVIACRQLGWGQTATYGELARRAGSPAASRAVGAVMARNRHPLIVPCHRVLAADGSLRGFSAADGLKMKQRLLDHEKWSVPPSQASDQGLALTHN